jgi:hypothetical protein
MQDFIESAKRAAGNAVERAAFEADKVRRSTARQHDVELAQRERSALLEQIAGLLLDLEARGQLAPETLRQLGQRLRQLETEISSAQSEVQVIRNEAYRPGSVSIQVTHNPPPGAPASPASPASPAAPAPVAARAPVAALPPQPTPVAVSAPCPTCRKPVRAGAAFCPSCGARLS